MQKPVFTETMQIGLVGRDLDAAIRRHVNDYGIGPWEFSEFDHENVKDLREYGKPVKRSWRLATAMIGHVQWELIEPLDDESIYARFLAEKGEGVHHIAVVAPNFDETLAMQAKRGTTQS
jgi:methylmalonyl-CoA/ethylmalonyl-CoA epimerase